MQYPCILVLNHKMTDHIEIPGKDIVRPCQVFFVLSKDSRPDLDWLFYLPNDSATFCISSNESLLLHIENVIPFSSQTKPFL